MSAATLPHALTPAAAWQLLASGNARFVNGTPRHPHHSMWRRRDLAAHRAWMIRAYALSLGAGTQVITEGLSQGVLGSGVFHDDLAKGAGWAVNLAVAELAIRRPTRRER